LLQSTHCDIDFQCRQSFPLAKAIGRKEGREIEKKRQRGRRERERERKRGGGGEMESFLK
jgi:hypothetical protein